jgi:hypothetical protein
MAPSRNALGPTATQVVYDRSTNEQEQGPREVKRALTHDDELEKLSDNPA